jgi:ABC-type sugar transport system ATPase subunit
MVREAQKILDEIGFKLPAAAMLSDLTIGQQQLVATARASTRGTRFLIFDEPIGYLTRQEAVQLFNLIRRLKAQGVTIVYISHRLEEVFQLADRVSILRDGTLVSTQRVADTNEERLIAGMINRSIDHWFQHGSRPAFGRQYQPDDLHPYMLSTFCAAFVGDRLHRALMAPGYHIANLSRLVNSRSGIKKLVPRQFCWR